ncbi:large conductance mechanosensitive channel protein MscL [Mycoplasma seminis]|uniref:MscL family protein n=1 Tax=Mycoplasma seminis TaxID=512749 RepID=A0ABY9HBI0_9MOLU|nr:MscL family protein [Mycoplasma seminis]WLP85945.1 MscL family protein [Mycoplasma seminis]
MSKAKELHKKSWSDSMSSMKKGNLLMLAIGFLLGGVFTALVSSFANDIIMAAITRAFGTSTNDWVLAPVYDKADPTKIVGGIYLGKFIAALFQFIIVSVVVFGILYVYFWAKNYSDYRKALKNPVVEVEPVAAAPTTDELILAELRKLNEKADAK